MIEEEMVEFPQVNPKIDMKQRIAKILRDHGVGDECLVDWTRPDCLASALVAALNLENVIGFIVDDPSELRPRVYTEEDCPVWADRD